MAADEMTAREMFDALVDRLVAAERGYGSAEQQRNDSATYSSGIQYQLEQAHAEAAGVREQLRQSQKEVGDLQDMHGKATVIFEAAATMNLVAANRHESPPFDPQAMDALSKALKDTNPIPF